jgi:hypothetical protein
MQFGRTRQPTSNVRLFTRPDMRMKYSIAFLRDYQPRHEFEIARGFAKGWRCDFGELRPESRLIIDEQ